MPDCQPNQVTEDDASYIALGRLQIGVPKLSHLLDHQPRQRARSIGQPSPREAPRRATYEHGVDDRGAGAVDMDRGAHLCRAGNGRGTGQTRIEHGDGGGQVGFQAVVVVSECQWRPRLERLGHLLEHPGKALCKMVQPAPHADIACQLIGIAGRGFGESRLGVAHQAAQPYVAEVHQLGILNVPEVRRVGQHRVKFLAIEVFRRSIRATQGDRAPRGRQFPVVFLADPLIPDENLLLSKATVPDFEGFKAVGLGAGELFDDIQPPAASDRAQLPVYPRQVGFTLNIPNRKAVN